MIPLHGVLMVERGERCHLLPLSETKNLGVNIQQVLNLLIAVQGDTHSPQINWVFVRKEGKNISFGEMNDSILERIQITKNDDVRDNNFELKYTDI